MNVKGKIREYFCKYSFLKRVYFLASQIKGMIYYGSTLVVPIIGYKVLHKKPVFLIFTPEHANLGDHAIAYAEGKLLKRLNVGYYEITGKQLYKLHQYKFLKVLNGATLFINGGGNLGTLWPEIEKMNRWIISSAKKSVICIMPNSIYYESDEKGIRELQKSIELYNSHQRLYIYAREQISYEIMRKIYSNVKIVPDIVLTLNESEDQYLRRGCLFCMRNDIEGTVTREQFNTLYKIAKELFDVVDKTNTVLNYDVSVKNREIELIKLLDQLKKAELVVTDRLHGMIFCAITGTKCIVLSGKSPKILGCYEWIKDLGYIVLIDNVEKMKTAYQSMSRYPNFYNNNNLRKDFQILEDDIINLINIGTWIT